MISLGFHCKFGIAQYISISIFVYVLRMSPRLIFTKVEFSFIYLIGNDVVKIYGLPYSQVEDFRAIFVVVPPWKSCFITKDSEEDVAIKPT